MPAVRPYFSGFSALAASSHPRMARNLVRSGQYSLLHRNGTYTLAMVAVREGRYCSGAHPVALASPLVCWTYGQIPVSFVTSHTSTAFTFDMRCILLFSASQRHLAWDICSYNPSFSTNRCPKEPIHLILLLTCTPFLAII